MERNTQRHGLINVLIALGAGIAAFCVARYTNSLAGQIETVFLGLGILVAAVSWFQMRLEESERLERLELEELGKTHAESALFEGRDSDVFPAQRSREQFEKFFIPIFTVLLCLVEAGGAYFLWRWIAKYHLAPPAIKEPMAGAFLFLLLFLIQFLVGRFSATFARLENQRLLRPGASFLLLNAVLCVAVGGGIIGVQGGYSRTDLYVAYVLCGLLAVIALETLVAVVLDIYRPRVKGKVERPIYESRLVGLLCQPQGLVTTAAQAIDYQFGFKVSETWFYRFFERAVLWLVPLQLLLLFLSTAVVIIEPGEQGLLEHFGKQGRTVLGPGAHFKLPWPAGKVYRFRTEQIQNFEVGVTQEGPELGRFVFWTVAHTAEENFLVANRDQRTRSTGGDQDNRTPPVSLVTGSIPVQYQITNLIDWAYVNEDAPSLLQDRSTREVVRYLAGADLNELMCAHRLEAAQELAQRIQAAANERGLGARIVSVGLQDLHPPVKVADDYEKVVGADQTRQARILEARAQEIRTNALAGAQAVTITNSAESDSVTWKKSALARAASFTNQIPAYQAAPSVYAQRSYLQAFVRATAKSRKYLLLTSNRNDVIVYDLQDSIARDILNNVTVPGPKMPTK